MTKKLETKLTVKMFWVILCMMMCLAYCGTSAKAAEIEKIDEPASGEVTTMGMNKESPVTINTEKKFQWFKFTADEEGFYYFSTTGENYSNSEAVLYTYGEEWNDDQEGYVEGWYQRDHDLGDAQQGMTFGQNLDEGESCYVKAFCYGTKTASYNLSIARAEDLQTGAPKEVSIGKAGETKWYAFTNTEASYDYYTFLTTGENSKLSRGCLYEDSYRYKYDDNGNFLYRYRKYSVSGKGSDLKGFRFNSKFIRGEKVYIAVNSMGGGTADFSLYVNSLGNINMQYSEFPSTVDGLSLNQTTLIKNTSMNEDKWLSFTAPEDGEYRFKISGAGAVYSYARVYYPSGWWDFDTNVFHVSSYSADEPYAMNQENQDYMMRCAERTLYKGQTCYLHFMGNPGSEKSIQITPYYDNPGDVVSETSIKDPEEMNPTSATITLPKGSSKWLSCQPDKEGFYACRISSSNNDGESFSGYVYEYNKVYKEYKEYREIRSFTEESTQIDPILYQSEQPNYIYLTSDSDEDLTVTFTMELVGYQHITKQNVSNPREVAVGDNAIEADPTGTMEWYEFTVPLDGYYNTYIFDYDRDSDHTYINAYDSYVYEQVTSTDPAGGSSRYYDWVHKDDGWYSENDIDNFDDYYFAHNLKKGDKVYFSVKTTDQYAKTRNLRISYDNPYQVKEDEIPEQIDSVDLGTSYPVSIKDASEEKWFKFTPDTSTKYTIYTDDDLEESYIGVYKKYYNGTKYSFSKISTRWHPLNKDGEKGFSTLSMEAGREYYLCASAGGRPSADYRFTVINNAAPKSIQSIKQITPYSSILDYDNYYDDVDYGEGEAEIDYNGFTRKIHFGNFKESKKSEFNGRMDIELKDSNQATAWKHKNMGTYTFNATMYDKKGVQVGASVEFERKIVSFTSFNKNAKDIKLESPERVAGINPAVNIFKYTAKASGNYVLHYSKEVRSFVHVYNAEENRTNWKKGNERTYYGKMTAGKTYYIVVTANSEDNNGNVLLGYYNNATNPNASANPATNPNANVNPNPAKKSITVDMVKLSAGKTVYTGTEQKPTVELKDGTKALVESVDYTVTYSGGDYIAANTYTITVSGQGTYDGAVPLQYVIEPKSMNSSDVTVTLDKEEYAYTGREVQPKVTVKDGTKVLLSKDYTVSFDNNVDKTTDPQKPATVSITGKGNYKDTTTKNFTIVDKSIESVTITPVEISLEKGMMQSLVATITPVEASDCEIKWSSEKEVVATVSDKGVVTALSVGETEITATATDSEGKTKSGSCKVTVTDPVSAEKIVPTVNVDVEPEKTGAGDYDIPTTLTEAQQNAIEAAIEAASEASQEVSNPDEKINVTIRIPQKDGSAPEIPVDLFEKAAESNVDKIEIQTKAQSGDANSVEAVFTFDVSSGSTVNSMPINTGINAVINNEEAKDIVSEKIPTDANTVELQLAHEGDFPVPVTITLSVEGKFQKNDTVYLYYINTETKKVELVKESGLIVDDNYKIHFTLTHASCYVVSSKPSVNATSIGLNVGSLEIEAGSSEILTAAITPNNTTDKRITWTSSNNTVATVKDGTVTGIKAGTTIITAKTSNGLEATCTVTVKEKSTITQVPQQVVTPTPQLPQVKVGQTIKIGTTIYKIIKPNEVQLTGITKKTVNSYTVLEKCNYQGSTYKITSIKENAFKNCKRLKKLVIKSKILKSIGKNALKGTAKKLVIQVPASKKKVYKNLLQKSGNKTFVIK